MQQSHQFAPTELPLPPQGMPMPAPGNSLLGIAWRRKGFLIFFLLCGLGGGYWYFTQQVEKFASSALVEVYRQQAQTSTGSALEEIQDLAPSPVFIEAELKSDEVLQDAVSMGQLGSFPGMPSDPSGIIIRLRGGLRVDSPIETTSRPSDRSLVQVKFESTDPALCAAVVNSAVQAYEKYVNSRHTKSMDAVVSFFRQAKDSIMPQLNKLEAEYNDFQKSAPLEWTADGQAINPFREDALQLEETIHDIASQIRQMKTKLALIEETSKTRPDSVSVLRDVQYLIDDVSDISQMQQDLMDAPNSDVELKTKLMTLKVQAELYADQYAANHPIRQSVEKELLATENALREIQRAIEVDQPEKVDIGARREEAAKTLLRSYIYGVQKRVQLLEADLEDANSRLTEVRDKAHQLIAYENDNDSYLRQIGRLQDMIDSFESQLEKAELPLMNSGLQVNVLQPAGIGRKVGPDLLSNLLIGAFLGLLSGGAISWLVDWSERTFRNPDEVSETLSMPILTHMPLMLLKRKARTESDEHESVDRVVSVVHDPHSPGSEAIRSVRTALFATPSKNAEYQIVQVTSALPGDGKSTVAANLGASVANANKRVLMIDADLRRPTVGSLFGVNESTLGLTSVLNGECSYQDAVQPTSVLGLDVLPTGPKPSNPAEALMLPEFGQLLDDLRSDYDLILIDTPPLLAVTDASNVATQVDGVLFVMRIGRNIKPMSKRAVTMLRSLHVNLIGVVINAIGDSGYSATYASAWSASYGGQPGSEYGYGYYRYGSDRYLDASRGSSVTVRGSKKAEPRRLVASSTDSNGDGADNSAK